MTPPSNGVRFAEADLDRFRRASHDRNPLHGVPEYARRTPFGRPVAYGMLAGLAGLARAIPPKDRMLRELRVDFPSAGYPDESYRVQVTPGEADTRVSVLDGRRALCRLRAMWQPHRAQDLLRELEVSPSSPATEAAVLGPEDLSSGLVLRDTYAPDPIATRELVDALGGHLSLHPPSHISALFWASYLVGMRWPGRDALFSRARFRFGPAAPDRGEFEYRAELASFDERFQMLRIVAELDAGGGPFVEVELQAVLRGDPVSSDELEPSWSSREKARTPNGKSALVVGASRGLGASMAFGLAREGWTAYASYVSSVGDAEELRRGAAALPGTVIPVRADAGDLDQSLALRDRIRGERGSLELLVLCASPALRPLWIETESVERLNEYVRASVSLVSAPLSVFLGELADSEGTVVVVSSQAVSEPVPDWPHYVAAKGAIEALTETAALEYPAVRFLVVRPPRLLTHFVDSPLARASALDPGTVGAAILNRLADGLTPGGVDLLETFDTGGRQP